MCLSARINLNDIVARLPEEFTAYKFLNFRDGELVGPVYKYNWRPGVLEAELTHRGNGDPGFYVMAFEPSGVHLRGDDRRRILPLIVRREDVVAGGPDWVDGASGLCLVVRKVVLTQENYDGVVSGKLRDFQIAAALAAVKETVSQVRKEVKVGDQQKSEQAKETVQEARSEAKNVQTTEQARTEERQQAQQESEEEKVAQGKKVVAAAKKAAKKRETVASLVKAANALLARAKKLAAKEKAATKAKSKKKSR